MTTSSPQINGVDDRQAINEHVGIKVAINPRLAGRRLRLGINGGFQVLGAGPTNQEPGHGQ